MNTKNFDKRNWLENRFNDLNLGDLDMSGMDDDTLENLVKELEAANEDGKLNLETAEGIDNLTAIVGKYE